MAKEQTPVTVKPEPIPRPRIDVLERSLQSPLGIPAAPIDLKEKGFVCHWINTELKGGAQLHYVTEHGWLKVRPDYLADPEGFQWQQSPDGYVTRGERHREILMYTTLEHARQRATAKQQENARRMRQTTQDTIEAAGNKYGDEAAEFLARQSKRSVSVKDSYERIAATPDSE